MSAVGVFFKARDGPERMAGFVASWDVWLSNVTFRCSTGLFVQDGPVVGSSVSDAMGSGYVSTFIISTLGSSKSY